MKEGGKGGDVAAKSGIDFENKNSFLNIVSQDPNLSYEFIDTDSKAKNKPFKILGQDKLIAEVYFEKQMYNDLLSKENVFWGDYFYKMWKPDTFVINFNLKKCFVVEMKNQKTPGSVDEKLQSFNFKIEYYKKILSKSNSLNDYEFEYLFVLSDWFYTDKVYKDTEIGEKAGNRKNKSVYLDTLEYLDNNKIKHFNFFPSNYVLFGNLE